MLPAEKRTEAAPEEPNPRDIGKSMKQVLRRRAFTTGGFCAVAVIGFGRLVRVIGSYDPDRAAELVHRAVGLPPDKKQGKLSLTDPRDWFSLAPEQVVRILRAAELPIVPLDWDTIRKKGVPSQFAPEETCGYSAASVGFLLNELHLLGIYPPSARRPPLSHAEKLAKAARRFRDVLNHKDTARLLSDWPELKEFRSRTTELNILASMTADARQAEAKRQRHGVVSKTQSPREVFIRDHLARCFESLYGRKAGASRPSGTGEIGGPFIRFAVTFFAEIGAEIGLPIAAETIARDLRRRPRKKDASPLPR